ncbi:hypothetical protein BOTBODRAFT_375026 [Botryobasidium botryosum FD-172 SS1]|uniref:Uncharacterized protein n=1 Tax=Botryobasidium botryosum (strain FD-172 SS1) TaxID=930990 RepID=A0A067MVF0_BOTB1|nr:hypothetical protein BOTBODRAFT_375026 [Botryobasidium botryosum FD-172 SS1]
MSTKNKNARHCSLGKPVHLALEFECLGIITGRASNVYDVQRWQRVSISAMSFFSCNLLMSDSAAWHSLATSGYIPPCCSAWLNDFGLVEWLYSSFFEPSRPGGFLPPNKRARACRNTLLPTSIALTQSPRGNRVGVSKPAFEQCIPHYTLP